MFLSFDVPKPVANCYGTSSVSKVMRLGDCSSLQPDFHEFIFTLLSLPPRLQLSLRAISHLIYMANNMAAIFKAYNLYRWRYFLGEKELFN